MDPKRSAHKPPSAKKRSTKRSGSQDSFPCLTEPNYPYNETSRYSELPNINTERTIVDPIKLQKAKKEKEACAIAYLRGLSDEESSLNDLDRKMTHPEDDLDPIDSSGRLSPFMNSTKRHANPQSQNAMFAPNNTQTQFPKKIKKVRRRTDSNAKRESSKRTHSEPNERTSTKNANTKIEPPFIFYEPLPKAPLNKINIGADVIDTSQVRYYEKFNQIATEPDYYDITAPIKEKDLPLNSDNSKPPPILQVRRLVGYNYSRILQGMREYRETGVFKDIKSLPKGGYDRQDSARKVQQPKEKKYPGVPPAYRRGPNNIVMVGRSVSVPKFPGEFESYVDNEYNMKKLSIEDTRERQKTSLSDEEDTTREMRYKDEILKGVRSISSAGTSRRNFRGDSDFNTRPFSGAGPNFFYEDQKEEPVFITKPTNESPSETVENRVKTVEDEPRVSVENRVKTVEDVRDIKDIQELKVGFWFKAKKGMLNPPSPKKEAASNNLQEKPQGLSFRRKRETCKENKVLLDKVSEVYKFKMGVINSQQTKTQANKSPFLERSATLKGPLNVKDLNLYKKEPRASNTINKQLSFREAYSIDLKGLDGKAPKLKAILSVLNKELKIEKHFSPERKRSSSSIYESKNISQLGRKGSDGLAQFINMKGSGMKLKTSRFDEY